jgi:uncharacterized protein (TIGR03663 family)
MISRWSAVALLLIVAAAAALRVPNLGVRPLHNDEAVNAVKVTELWQHGRYKYDPDEYHGPTLHYATLPFLSLSSARNANEVSDGLLRAATVVFGIALIFLLWFFVEGLGRNAVLWAALFIAISPAMVFYSRYFIHEMLLVFFTALTLGAGCRYMQTRRGRWAAVTGAGAGLMWATKETFVLTMAAIVIAAVMTSLTLGTKRAVQEWRAAFNWRHIGLAIIGLLAMWLVFFSSFFTNFHGLIDSVTTYLPWLKRAGGHSPHLHPWHFYLERLVWFQPKKSPVWSELLIVALALVGIVAAFLRGAALPRFLAIYTVVLTGIYSAISYKTPWCLLSFYLGMILLAGFGAAALVELCRARALKISVAVVILALASQLTMQARRASMEFAADRRNPYVYAQTGPKLLELVERVKGIARFGGGDSTTIKVIVPDSGYWPLPWYLRQFANAGWYGSVPADPYAPIVVADARLDARLDEKSERKWIMAGITEIRPGVFLELYVELELWKKYVETLPRDRDE